MAEERRSTSTSLESRHVLFGFFVPLFSTRPLDPPLDHQASWRFWDNFFHVPSCLKALAVAAPSAVPSNSPVHAIKLDVEGLEPPVFMGAAQLMLDKLRPKLFIMEFALSAFGRATCAPFSAPSAS